MYIQPNNIDKNIVKQKDDREIFIKILSSSGVTVIKVLGKYLNDCKIS